MFKFNRVKSVLNYNLRNLIPEKSTIIILIIIIIWLAILISALIFVPIFTIWSINCLFRTKIEISLVNWAAMAWVITLAKVICFNKQSN